MSGLNLTEIIVAIIGMVGVVSTGLWAQAKSASAKIKSQQIEHINWLVREMRRFEELITALRDRLELSDRRADLSDEKHRECVRQLASAVDRVSALEARYGSDEQNN